MSSHSIVDDAELRIRHLPGESKSMVVTFTGAQFGLGGIPMEEFVGSARGDNLHHVLFVSDVRRTWFSFAPLVERITRVVTRLIEDNRIERVHTLGTSLGGYGAILFSRVFGAVSVAAFAPQISMHPDVIAETRWMKFRDGFGPDLKASVAEVVLAATVPVFVTFGGRSEKDRQQAALLHPAPHLHLRVLKGADHMVSKSLKDAGLLRDIVASKLAGNVARVSYLLDQYEQMAANRAAPLFPKSLGGASA